LGKLDSRFLAHMEQILALYMLPYNSVYPPGWPCDDYAPLQMTFSSSLSENQKQDTNFTNSTNFFVQISGISVEKPLKLVVSKP
jgi:hypothetical protein